MSVYTGARVSAPALPYFPLIGKPGAAMAPEWQPLTKAHCFVFSVSNGPIIDDIIDAIEEIVCPCGLFSPQQPANYKFCALVKTAATAAKLNERGAFVLNGVLFTVSCVRPQVLYVTVY